MQQTYSINEIKDLLRSLEQGEIDVLQEVVEEEKESYLLCELKAINHMLSIRSKYLSCTGPATRRRFFN